MIVTQYSSINKYIISGLSCADKNQLSLINKEIFGMLKYIYRHDKKVLRLNSIIVYV